MNVPARFWLASVVAALATGAAVAGPAGDGETENRPLAAISQRLVMIQGRAAVPLADVARALGGSLEPAAEPGRYGIRSGPGGVLRFDPAGRRPVLRQPRRAAGESPDPAVSEAPGLRIDGQPVAAAIVVQGREPHLMLDDLAALFGGRAVFDPALGQWGISGAAPGWALSFR